jgi:serine/threonine protein kinase
MPRRKRGQMSKSAAMDANNTNLQPEKEARSPLQELEAAVSNRSQFEVFTKNYKLGRLLGKGTYGAVYIGESNVDSKRVAVKMQKTTPENASILLRELKSLQLADNSYITRYVDSFLQHGKLYITMEFVDGITLRHLASRFQLRYSTISAITTCILKALSHMHERRLMHRDVKGDNILVGKNGDVKLADFGLAMLEGSPTQKGLGSPGFIAPEAITTDNYSVQVDIWSLGMTVLQVLNKAVPYSEVADETGGTKLETVTEIYRRIVNNEKPRLHNKNIPEIVKDFMLACLTYKPSERPTANALQQHEFIVRAEPPQQLRETLSNMLCDGPSSDRQSQ